MQNQSLQLQLNELKKIIFGSKSETFIAAKADAPVQQTDLFPNDKLGHAHIVKTTLVQQYEKKLNVNHPGRNPLPDALRREVIELLPQEDVTGLKVIGKEIKEVLEYLPGVPIAIGIVKQFVRSEYIKPSAGGLHASRVIAAYLIFL